MAGSKKLSRRAFLAKAGGSLVSISLPGVFVKLVARENVALAAQIRPDGRPRIPPSQQPVKRLYDMGGIQSTATPQDWQLRIHGEVEKPTTLTFQQLIELKQVELTCDVHCVTGWTLLDSEWSGVRLSTIMDLVKPKKNARFVIFEAAANYTSNIPIIEARKDNVILAHSFFGKSLPRPHGAPVRALVPDRYFYKSAKWLAGIKFTAQDEPGYWERLGYSNSADPWKEERSQ
jgi:DMSO/TMAO reductase YedYZ molybdopterin-dependent catalytic subunit